MASNFWEWLPRPWWFPPVPGRPALSRENPEEVRIVALKFKVNLPPSKAHDLASRELRVMRNSGAEEVVTLDGTAQNYQLMAERGDAVSVVLVDIDTSGNRSLPSSPLLFVARDTVPPPQPEGLSVDPTPEEVDETTGAGGAGTTTPTPPAAP